VGYCTGDGSCLINLNFCAQGGRCTVNLGYCSSSCTVNIGSCSTGVAFTATSLSADTYDFPSGTHTCSETGLVAAGHIHLGSGSILLPTSSCVAGRGDTYMAPDVCDSNTYGWQCTRLVACLPGSFESESRSTLQVANDGSLWYESNTCEGTHEYISGTVTYVAA
jgi:hypothetical protein